MRANVLPKQRGAPFGTKHGSTIAPAIAMEPITGVFRSPQSASETAAALHRAGFSRSHVNVLLPGSSERPIYAVEPPGAAGAAFGGVFGGALGLVTGYGLGAAVTSLIPGVGPVVAVGIAAGALLGAGGAVGGAIAGSAQDRHFTHELPAGEIFFYEDALREGRSVVIVFVDDEREAERARYVMSRGRAESLDAARESWWIGLRDAEREHYRDFESDHAVYRAGFEAALQPDVRSKSAAQARDCLVERFPDLASTEPFRRGFERGQAYWSQRCPEASAKGSSARSTTIRE